MKIIIIGYVNCKGEKMKIYLAFDIGGTKLKYALISEQGQLLKRYSESTIVSSKSEFIKRFNQIVDKFETQISGIGVSVPGKVDFQTQKISFGGPLPFLDGISFNEILNTRLPVFVENDANAATLAEMWLGSLRDVNSGVMLVLGTAVGSGIMINKRLLYGVHQQAGEVSFVSYSKLDKEHMMGSQGSAVALIEDIARNAKLSELDDGRAVFKMINQGNSYAVNRFKIFCQNLASLIYNMQTILDVERFVIGGGISQQSIVVKGINQALCDLRQTSSFVSTTLEAPRVVSSRLYNDANLFGAISHFELRDVNNLSQNIEDN